MYVSGLEFSRAAAASHKVEKGKKGRDFKVKKSPVICTKEIWGYFLLLFKQLCKCVCIHGTEHTGGTFFKQESKCRQHLAFVNSSCELRAATTQFWLKNSHRHCCQVGSGVTNSGYQNQLCSIKKMNGLHGNSEFCELTQLGAYTKWAKFQKTKYL